MNSVEITMLDKITCLLTKDVSQVAQTPCVHTEARIVTQTTPLWWWENGSSAVVAVLDL